MEKFPAWGRRRKKVKYSERWGVGWGTLKRYRWTLHRESPYSLIWSGAQRGNRILRSSCGIWEPGWVPERQQDPSKESASKLLGRRSLGQPSRVTVTSYAFVTVVQSLTRVRLFATPWTAATRLLCPPLSLRVFSNSCLLSQWCYLTISSSATSFFCIHAWKQSNDFWVPTKGRKVREGLSRPEGAKHLGPRNTSVALCLADAQSPV